MNSAGSGAPILETQFHTERNVPAAKRKLLVSSFQSRTHIQLEEIKKPNQFELV